MFNSRNVLSYTEIVVFVPMFLHLSYLCNNAMRNKFGFLSS